MNNIVLSLALVVVPLGLSTSLHADDLKLPFKPVNQVAKDLVTPTAADKPQATTDNLKNPLPGKLRPVADGLRPTEKPPTLKLPGLPDLGSKAKDLNPATIFLKGGNEVVYVSNVMTNRIATPFARPVVIDTSETEYQVVGQDVYVTITNPEAPVSVFIREKGQSNSPVASLTLVPKPIPSQNVNLVFLEGFREANGRSVEAPEQAHDYVSRIKSIMRGLALNEIPKGFVEARLQVGIARAGNVLVIPERMYSGQSLNVYRFEAQNIGTEPVELTEPSFWREGVRAVSFWPRVKLDPKAVTTVFVIADKLDDSSLLGARK